MDFKFGRVKIFNIKRGTIQKGHFCHHDNSSDIVFDLKFPKRFTSIISLSPPTNFTSNLDQFLSLKSKAHTTMPGSHQKLLGSVNALFFGHLNFHQKQL